MLTLKLYYNSSNFLLRSLSPFHNFLLGEFKVLWLMASIIISIRKYDDDGDHDRDRNDEDEHKPMMLTTLRFCTKVTEQLTEIYAVKEGSV